jgi:hypothetical protein
MRYSSVLVVCPSEKVTAGPEALHMLAAGLNRLGQPAAMVYHPFDKPASPAPAYEKYAVPVTRYSDTPGSLIVFPEIFTSLALDVGRAQAAIWWLSVNNFTCERYGNPLRDRFRYFRNQVMRRSPWGGVPALRHLRHIAQSHYAEEFLKGYGVAPQFLADPIPVYLEPEYQARLPGKLARAQRQNHILYNPLKGAAVTARLRAAFPDWTFRPLQGLDREQLADAFLSAKLYIDFGHHPGKDRLPMEAALHGCCVIAARHGAAADPVDMPVPDRYKLDVKASDFVANFGALVQDIFANFASRARDFDRYRAKIAAERDAFDADIAIIFL